MAAMLAVASVALASLTTAHAAPRIGPGAFITAPEGCTLNFVFESKKRTFVGTAGHCTHRVGQRVHLDGYGAFGRVVFRQEEGQDDVALIRIGRRHEHLVDPSIPLIGIVPTGYTRSGMTAIGDHVSLEGNGMILGDGPTRERTGLLTRDDATYFTAIVPAIFGDSGGPVVHVPSGRALGVVSGIAVTIPPSTLIGTTVERFLSLVREAGFKVRLVTARG